MENFSSKDKNIHEGFINSDRDHNHCNMYASQTIPPIKTSNIVTYFI